MMVFEFLLGYRRLPITVVASDQARREGGGRDESFRARYANRKRKKKKQKKQGILTNPVKSLVKNNCTPWIFWNGKKKTAEY